MAETRPHAPAHRVFRLGLSLAFAAAVLLAYVAPPTRNAGNLPNTEENAAKALAGYVNIAIFSIANTESTGVAPSTHAAAPGAPAPTEPASPLAVATLKVPGPVRLQYDVRAEVQGLTADAVADLIWRHDDHAYSARLDLTLPLVGTRTQTSVGRMTPEGLAPTRFTDRARHEQTADFERAPDGVGGKIVFSAGTPAVPLLAGAQDRLSAFVQLGAMLAGAPGKYPVGAAIRLQIVGPRDAETWLFRVDGMQRLRLPYGTLDTVKLTRNPPHPSDSKLEMWLAPSMGYLPVRIRLTQANGDRFDQRLRASEGL